MREDMEYKEITAKTVEDAITQACVELSVTHDRLDFEVISEGSKGFLGIGSKPAVIRYRKKEEEKPEIEISGHEISGKEKSSKAVKDESALKDFQKRKENKDGIKKTAETDKTERTEAVREEEKENKEDSPKKEGRERNRRNRNRKERPKKEKPASSEKKETLKEIIPVDRTEEELTVMKEAAADFLTKVFAAMDLPVEIKSEYERETNCLNIELAGDDMGVLIGKRGQTLDSLQYLTSLCVNKNIKEYVRVKIDTEDYRRRRKETLENLAKNIASKVKKTGKAVVLEPMNPYERRIIHSALQPNSYVETYSEGNEPYRHVVVVPKK